MLRFKDSQFHVYLFLLALMLMLLVLHVLPNAVLTFLVLNMQKNKFKQVFLSV